SWPVKENFPGSEYAITSNEAFFLKRAPARVVIVGGGYIGVEFAGIFHGLGVRTTQLYRGDLFLRGFDDDIRLTLAEEMRKRGVDLRFSTGITRIDKTDGGLRAPLTRALGLEKVGVALRANGAVIVDEYSKSSVDSIYAIGDCTDRMMLTPVAIAEGMAVANTLFNRKPMRPRYLNVPTAVFSTPNCGTVGLTEQDARQAGYDLDIYRSHFKPLRHT